MATNLHNSPIYGPVHSRRLGLSLGINLMPADGKYCTFDCIYCECGLNAQHHTTTPRPTRNEVAKALENQLKTMAADCIKPDVLTFAGNGEPTAHPDFPGIIADTIALRGKYCPKAKIAVLSNSTMIMRQEVFDTLMKVDDNILKLDTANPSYINKVDRPVPSSFDIGKIISRMAEFSGHVIIQTMFMKGEIDGFNVDNTSEKYVAPWLEALKAIRPGKVMIYTIDREPPIQSLRKISPEVLDAIKAKVEKLGIECSAAY